MTRPTPHDPHTVRDAEDLIEVVADHQNGESLLLQPGNRLFDRLGLGDAERRGRLVHQDELRAPGACTGDRHDLPLTAGETFDRLPDRRHVPDETLEHVGRVGQHRRLVEDVQGSRAGG